MGIPNFIVRNDVVTPLAPVPVARRVTPRPRHVRRAAYAFEARAKSSVDRPGHATSLAGAKCLRDEFLTQVALLSRVEFPVLLLGGNHTEARAVARLLHTTSPRASHPFAEVNCLASREASLALELFGSEGTTPPGTKHIKVGLFERCHQGTVFLSEIVGLPRRWQARLVDLLDEKRLCRLGGSSWVNVDVRVIMSTSMNVEWALATGELRTDLYYRMQILGID